MVAAEGVEHPTPWVVAKCSIHMGYGQVKENGVAAGNRTQVVRIKSPVHQPLCQRPMFFVFGTTSRTRTCRLNLRRVALYPDELWS